MSLKNVQNGEAKCTQINKVYCPVDLSKLTDLKH